MGVLDMTPFVLHTSEVSQSFVDENGNRHQGTTTYTPYVKCDVVPAGAANTKDFGDGITQTYSYTIYVYDRYCRLFKLGEKIKYGRGGWLSKEFVVKGFHRYQTYCIMWI